MDPAAAEPPQRLEEQITDASTYLSSVQVRRVTTALKELEDGHGIVLHVVLVEDFDGMDGIAWAEESFDRTGLGADDALLAVAVEAGRYGLIDETDVRPERARQIATEEVEPQLREGDWAGAALAAAQGYAVAEPVGARSPWAAVLGALGAIAAVAAAVVGGRAWRSRRRLAGTVLAQRERTSLRIGQLRQRLEELGQEVRFVPTELDEQDAQWAGEQHQQAQSLLDEAVTRLGRVPREARSWPASQDTALGWKYDVDGASRALDRLDEHLSTSVTELRRAREIVTEPALLTGLATELETQRLRRQQLAGVDPVTEPPAPPFVRRRVAELLGQADAGLGEVAAAHRSATEYAATRQGREALAAVTSAREQLAQARTLLDRAADPQAELQQALTDLGKGQRGLRRRLAEGDRELDRHSDYARRLHRRGPWAELSPDVLAEALRVARELVAVEPGVDPQAQLGRVELAASGLATALEPYQQARAELEERERRRARERARLQAEEEDASWGWGSSWSSSSSSSRSSSSRSSRSSSSSRSSGSSSRNRSGGRF